MNLRLPETSESQPYETRMGLQSGKDQQHLDNLTTNPKTEKVYPPILRAEQGNMPYNQTFSPRKIESI